ncbi:MAG TPA: hypothetical protein VL981_06040 [Candidatus Methylacidiphilales bacterium]|nr:hypothetical protein [Candidatus Methylacidiphilales bacterium]
MAQNKVPIYELSFWWSRYLGGIAVPAVFALGGICSILTRHSYVLVSRFPAFATQWMPVWMPVEGEQAILAGVAYLGFALMFFAQCHAQYHEKMVFYSDRLLALGALLAGGGYLWCLWIFAGF